MVDICMPTSLTIASSACGTVYGENFPQTFHYQHHHLLFYTQLDAATSDSVQP
ncbi:hypothetical protein BDZ94DRAFT_1256687 [Collybia nuda]|uniref:Uncharacterized protein n=1 Tax=Collybia nuda TaxID=64659 RepID=A0A9P6CKW1_9AGAR|nr:hypothetical protein BDZ94DRAFT_1256687 [Collybia nuda]